MSTRFNYFIEQINSPFEWEDLKNAAEAVEEIWLYTFIKPIGGKLPDNVKLVLVDFSGYNRTNKLNLINYTIPIVKELFSSIKYWKHPTHIIYTLSRFSRTIYLSREITRLYLETCSKDQNTVFYSFWFSDLANALSICSREKLRSKKNKWFTRVHGTDLYEYRAPITRRIAFRPFFLKGFDKICSVSLAGYNYLLHKYPWHKENFFHSYLGTHYFGLNPLTETNQLCIVSCAKVRNIKRVYLIAETLAICDSNIKWVHFGGIDESDPTSTRFNAAVKYIRTQKPNIEVALMGDVKNDSILNYYILNTVHAFISVSETEGLPVSMMEAISCGIPIISTDVGGCRELANEQTGILLNKDLELQELKHVLTGFLKSELTTMAFRMGVHYYWKDKFSEQNSKKFFDSLLTM